jgi:hypothetical protein
MADSVHIAFMYFIRANARESRTHLWIMNLFLLYYELMIRVRIKITRTPLCRPQSLKIRSTIHTKRRRMLTQMQVRPETTCIW